MEFPAVSSAFAEHFGADAEIESPEDESDAWRSIVRECRRGGYPHLLLEVDRLLSRGDADVVQFLESHAPAWTLTLRQTRAVDWRHFIRMLRRTPSKWPNQEVELTGTRRAFTFQMVKPLSLRATLPLGSGSSSCSR